MPVSVMATPWAGRGLAMDMPSPVARPVDGARASGGPVWRGGSFLVGERGPELFAPQRSGFILPAALTAVLAGISTPSLAASADELRRIAGPSFDHGGVQSALPPADYRLLQQSRGATKAGDTMRNVSISPTIHINMTVNGVNDPEKIARELGRRVSQQLEGALFDIDTGF